MLRVSAEVARRSGASFQLKGDQMNVRTVKKVLLGLMLVPWGLGAIVVSCLSCGDPPEPLKPVVVITEADCSAMCAADKREMTVFIPSDQPLIICACADNAASYADEEGKLSPAKCAEECSAHQGVSMFIIVRGACLCG